MLSKQNFGGTITFEFIANTPVEDGASKVWHGALAKAANPVPTAEDIEMAKQVQAGALEAFSADFEIWKHKRPALRIIQLPNDGPFNKGRQWYKQFYDTSENAKKYHEKLNGTYHIASLEKPSQESIDELEQGIAWK